VHNSQPIRSLENGKGNAKMHVTLLLQDLSIVERSGLWTWGLSASSGSPVGGIASTYFVLP